MKEYENELYNKGIKYIAGIDEAGRGPLAGPVVIGCVIMPQDSFIEYVNDSKKVSETKREMLYEKITNEAIAWSTGIVWQGEIDEINADHRQQRQHAEDQSQRGHGIRLSSIRILIIKPRSVRALFTEQSI